MQKPDIPSPDFDDAQIESSTCAASTKFPAPTRFYSKRNATSTSSMRPTPTSCDTESVKLAIRAHRAAIGRILDGKIDEITELASDSLKMRVDGFLNVN